MKDATIKTFPYDDLESLEAHILVFVSTYNLFKLNLHHLITEPQT